MWTEHEGTAEAGASSRSAAMTRATLPLKRVVESVRRRLLPRRMPRLVARY
jgi:hypothetical protein